MKYVLIMMVLAIALNFFCYKLTMTVSIRMPQQWVAKKIQVEGLVVSIPQQRMQSINFEFKIDTVAATPINLLTRISWFKHYPHLMAGERWALTLKLKPAHGLKNPGGFDYQKWLLGKGIVATGYVVPSSQPMRRIQGSSYSILALRQSLQDFIDATVHSKTRAAILAALAVGSRALLTASIWRVFQNSGTSHLIAISGLHVGLIAAVAYWFFYNMARMIPRLPLWAPAVTIASIASLCVAGLYGVMAGMSLPTQRAVIMVAVVMLSSVLRQSIPLWRRLLFAWVVIIIVEPAALYSASFWLSFSAVGWIVYGMADYKRSGSVVQWLRVQWVVTLGLLPLSLYFFHQVSCVLFFSNVVAIPWVSFVIVPLCFLGTLSYFISHALAHVFFVAAAYGLQPLWWWLRYLTQWHGSVWYYSISSVWLLLITMSAVLLYLTPRSMLFKWMSCFAVLPLLWPRTVSLHQHEINMTVLDVGQGLSVLVQTAHHTLIYDAGPKSMTGFDAGQSVVLPFMLYQHISHLDRMMISHGDNDHIGGAYAILNRFPNTWVLTSVPGRFIHYHVTRCVAGQQWQWDGVIFKVLYPPQKMAYQGNNSSCVLRINTGKSALLLTGDIEKPAEQWLLAHQRRLLAADVLLAPHHGSRTSSTPAFIAAVAPHTVVISTGFYNRYHFPSVSVLRRYQQRGVKILNTAKSGAIQLKI